jgi:hypothetical protein
MPAPAGRIIERLFERLRDGTAWKYNWGTAIDNSIWNVGRWTYINGIMVHVDFDFEGMWLLEVCDRDKEAIGPGNPTMVRWLAVATGHWPNNQHTKHRWFPAIEPQTFFERTVHSWDVIKWAMAWYKEIDQRGR